MIVTHVPVLFPSTEVIIAAVFIITEKAWLVVSVNWSTNVKEHLILKEYDTSHFHKHGKKLLDFNAYVLCFFYP